MMMSKPGDLATLQQPGGVISAVMLCTSGTGVSRAVDAEFGGALTRKVLRVEWNSGKPLFPLFTYFSLFFSFAAAARRRTNETHRGPWIFIVDGSGPHEISGAVDMGPEQDRCAVAGLVIRYLVVYSANQSRRGRVITVGRLYLPVYSSSRLRIHKRVISTVPYVV
jgi:hypothetical protein